jgi:hypothetical protein
MDAKIRALINSSVGGQPLSKALFYTDWRSGGFGLKSLVDRAAMCRINQVVQLYNSDLRKYVEWRILDEGSRRGFQIIEETEFMGWRDSFAREPRSGAKIGYSPWFDAFMACSRLDIRFNHFVDKGVGMFSLKDGHGVEKEVSYFDKSTLLDTLNAWIKRRYFRELTDQKLRGVSFKTLEGSVTSNFFMGNMRAPMSKALLRFTIRARNDTLWTPMNKALCYPAEYENRFCKCSTEAKSVVGNLSHILNSCVKFRGFWMKARHERIVGVMLDAIKYFLKVEDRDIWLDQSMKTVQRVDEVRDHNFKSYGWNEDILALRPDIIEI